MGSKINVEYDRWHLIFSTKPPMCMHGCVHHPSQMFIHPSTHIHCIHTLKQKWNILEKESYIFKCISIKVRKIVLLLPITNWSFLFYGLSHDLRSPSNRIFESLELPLTGDAVQHEGRTIDCGSRSSSKLCAFGPWSSLISFHVLYDIENMRNILWGSFAGWSRRLLNISRYFILQRSLPPVGQWLRPAGLLTFWWLWSETCSWTLWCVCLC